jgi:hypothetical protein
MAAQVDDVVDVLDRDRALVDAGAARDAVPDDLVGHGVRDERRRLGPVQDERTFGEELVAEPHDEELRRERLARVPGGAYVLAAAAFRARHRVQRLLPREVGDRTRAKAKLRLVVGVEAQRLQPAARTSPREEDVDRRGRDVQVLRAREVGQEAEDQQNVRPDERPLQDLRRRSRFEDVRDEVRER